jgi:hypothetical protein
MLELVLPHEDLIFKLRTRDAVLSLSLRLNGSRYIWCRSLKRFSVETVVAGKGAHVFDKAVQPLFVLEIAIRGVRSSVCRRPFSSHLGWPLLGCFGLGAAPSSVHLELAILCLSLG